MIASKLEHAIVMGGSMTGLLVARVLSERFERVTLVERDPLADSSEPRKGCPQGRHIHALLIRGEHILTELFPDLVDGILSLGAERVYSDEVAMYHFGYWKVRERFDAQYSALLFSRPLLEWQVAERVAKIDNVELRTETDILGVEASEDRSTITGVRIKPKNGGEEEVLSGDLVVDATGRGSSLPKWLKELGYEPPEEEHVKVEVAYTTRLFERPEAKPNWRVLQILPTPPENKTMGAIFPVEGNRWMVTLAAWFSEDPPKTDEAFLEFAKALPVPDLYEAIKDLTPLTPIIQHRLPSSRWRHYERLARMPGNILVMGDALASFNPIYGQGMTVCALECIALRDALGANLPLKKTQKNISRAFQIPWQISTGEDKRYPETGEQVPLPLKMIHWYGNRLHAASAHDAQVLKVAGEVNHMLRSPASIFRPDIVWRVLFGGNPGQASGANS